jgi:hypothetical protein
LLEVERDISGLVVALSCVDVTVFVVDVDGAVFAVDVDGVVFVVDLDVIVLVGVTVDVTFFTGLDDDRVVVLVVVLVGVPAGVLDDFFPRSTTSSV